MENNLNIVNKLNIEDYKEFLEKEEYEKVYCEIRDKSIELAKKLADIKNIDLDIENEDDMETKLFHIKFRFQKESASFREMIYLMKDLIEWNYEDFSDLEVIDEEELGINIEDVPISVESKEEKLQRYINRYNLLLNEIENYRNIERQIKEQGYEKLRDERIEELIKVFKEMLEYKKKTYDENWTFEQFVEKIAQYYNIFSESLWEAVSAIKYYSYEYDMEEDTVPINEVEALKILDSLYFMLTDENDDYKNYADFYRDFELGEGQTFGDLYKLEIAKFIKLFKDMLDFRNIEYDKNETDIDRLKLKVMEYYPYYSSMLFHLISPNPNTTYIQELSSMEDVYERISGEYKNHEENLIKYKEYMELLKKEGYIN